MKKTLPILILMLLFTANFATAQQPANLPDKPQPKAQPAENQFDGYFTFGGLGNDNRDYAGRVSEFTSSRQGGRGTGGGAFWGHAGRFYFDFQGNVAGDSRDQQYRLNVDAHRFWRTEVRYSRLPHRLDHDPLDSLDAAKGSIVVRHDDTDPGALYAIARGEVEVDSRFVIPKLKGVEFRFGFRDERRDGHAQARTLSKCANCHGVAQTRGVDQVTQDFSAGFTAHVSRLHFEYGYLNRTFRERAPTPMNVFDLAMQPVTGARIFDNRIQYQLADGPLPFNHIPDMRKESHTFKARLELPKALLLNLNYVQSTAENEETGLGVDSKVWSARLGVPLGKRAFLTARFRQMQIQGDSVWIDTVEPTAIAGPQLGLTYAQAYPTYASADYLRESVESRRPTTADFEFSYRFAKRTTLRAGYVFEQVRRDHYEVYETRRNGFRLSFTTRTADRKWQMRARYNYDTIEDPFAYLGAAFSPVLQPSPSPGSPPSPLLGTQYYTLYRAREADLTNQPSRAQGWEHSATWSPNARVSLSTHLRWRQSRNDRLNMSNWENSTLSPGFEAWFAPHTKFSITAGYYFHRDSGETLFVLPVFDG